MTDVVIEKDALLRLLKVIGGDPEDLQELLEDFEETTPNTLQEMKDAAANGDLAALRISSHSLKANGRDFGAMALARACEHLEEACRNGTVGDPVAEVDAISAELTRARAALSEVSL